MIFPLWVGVERPHFSVWPLFLLIFVNIAIFVGIEHLDKMGQAERNSLVHALGFEPSAQMDLEGPRVLILNYIGSEDSGLIHVVFSNFLHLDTLHLVFNMWFMWLFGSPIAGGLRARHFYFLFFASAIIGTVMQDLLSTSGSIGASGGVSGLMGFFFTHFLRQPVQCLLILYPIQLPAWFLIFAYLGPDIYAAYTSEESQVAYYAHLGGFMVGLIYGGYVKRLDDARVYGTSRKR